MVKKLGKVIRTTRFIVTTMAYKFLDTIVATQHQDKCLTYKHSRLLGRCYLLALKRRLKLWRDFSYKQFFNYLS